VGKEHRLAYLPRGWTVSLVRVITGWVFLQYGWFDKLQGGTFVSGISETLEKMARGSSFAFYRPFLEQVAIPHAHLFALLVAWGETLLGVSMLLGALVNLASVFGIFLMLNIFLASVSWEAVLYGALFLVFLRWSAGSRWGIDSLLALFLPPRLVYFPTR
jgi:thiosulfate dehydrogenase [quinone] large subunit